MFRLMNKNNKKVEGLEVDEPNDTRKTGTRQGN